MATSPNTTAEATVQRFLAHVNQRNFAAAAECYAIDAVVHDPMYPEPLRGRDAVRKDLETFFAAFPEPQGELREVLTRGDAYALELRMRGTNTGPLAGFQGKTIEPTNRRMDIGGSSHGRVNAEGLIVEERRYIDYLSMMQQLGLTEV